MPIRRTNSANRAKVMLRGIRTAVMKGNQNWTRPSKSLGGKGGAHSVYRSGAAVRPFGALPLEHTSGQLKQSGDARI